MESVGKREKEFFILDMNIMCRLGALRRKVNATLSARIAF